MIRMELGKNSYNIELERGNLAKAGELLNLNRKVMIITDEGVPRAYAEAIAEQSKEAYIKVVPQGEGSKSLQTAEEIVTEMLEHQFSRKDCVVAVGGGVVGDLGGFVASLYMRGVDFYNVPTTVLSQVDSSIGGKTAVNLAGIKNIIGAFYQPKKVLIDPDLLSTLPDRQISNGLAEAIKMALTSDRELFDIFEKEDITKLLLGVVGALPNEPDDSRYGVSVCKNIFTQRWIRRKNRTPSLFRLPISRDNCIWATLWTKRCRIF